MRPGLALCLLTLTAGAAGCAGRLSPKLNAPTASHGVALLECFLYPVDPNGVRSKFGAPDSFPARFAYLETMSGPELRVRGLSVYGTGLVIFPKLAPGNYRLSQVVVEAKEYTEHFLREVTTEFSFSIPPGTAGPLHVEAGKAAYIGRLTIHRVYTKEDVTRAPSLVEEARSSALTMSMRQEQEEEERAWNTLLEWKRYRRSAWGPTIAERVAELKER